MAKKTAIVSVYDKSNLDFFSKGLSGLGINILSTGGTYRFLKELGLEVQSISDYTGFCEILDGRVKSLHPKIHGGILARRDNKKDLAELEEQGIPLIDFVVVNLYPFIDKVNEVLAIGDSSHGSLLEFIDIGGPTMIRAAAKNYKDIVVVSDPLDYGLVLEELKGKGDISIELRRQLASKVFSTMASYDAEVSRYLSLDEKLFNEGEEPQIFAPYETIVLKKEQNMRYGENPHQKASFYRELEDSKSKKLWEVLQGKELSYNNLVDMQGALDLFLDLYKFKPQKEVAVVIKHTNPCGAACRESSLEAFKAARDCDPVSAFGGIIAVSGEVTKEVAESVLEGFVELLLVEKITEEAKEVLKKKKSIRLILCDFSKMKEESKKSRVSIKESSGGYLLQTVDNSFCDLAKCEVVSGKAPSRETLDDLQFAWIVCKNVKSNAIVVVKDLKAIGVGAGQMNRVDSARLAVTRANRLGHDVKGAVGASDAFLPFSDTLEVLNDSGVTSLVQPGGSIKDKEVIKVAKERDVLMIFTKERHFKH